MRGRLALLTATVIVLSWATAFAEPWPTLEQYARKCVLIVRVKQVGEYVSADLGPIELEVIEAWVGQFNSRDFVATRAGHILAQLGQHGLVLQPGQEAIVFYAPANQPVGKLANHSTAFPIIGEEIVYAATAWPSWPGSPESGPQRFTVAEFRKRIENARDQRSGSPVVPPVRP